MASKRLWVLGAADPEMQAVEGLLAEAGEQAVFAAIPGRDGGFVRVGPGQAYKAESLLATDGGEAKIPDDTEVVLVECGGAALEGRPFTRVDHHRHGDPGYGAPPEEFWPASSLGQVWSLLAGGSALGVMLQGEGIFTLFDYDGVVHRVWETAISDGSEVIPGLVAPWGDLRLPAAADHCLEAAYHGRCPGVDPEALGRWRAETRAAFQKRAVDDILRDVETARAALAAATRVRIGDTDVADLRDKEVPELPEAAVRDGTPYLAMPRPTERDPRKKVTLGAAQQEVVREFLETWASAHGLVELYGDPARGFAGGYLPD